MGKKIIIIILVIILAIPVLILFDDGFFNDMKFDPLPLTPQCASIGEAGTFENRNPDFVQRFFDENRICRTLNTDQEAHRSCVDEFFNGLPGYDFHRIPAQDEFGRFSNDCLCVVIDEFGNAVEDTSRSETITFVDGTTATFHPNLEEPCLCRADITQCITPDGTVTHGFISQ